MAVHALDLERDHSASTSWHTWTVSAATYLADLLSAGERLKMLVTSRAPLHILRRIRFPVAPLDLPGSDDFVTWEGLTHYNRWRSSYSVRRRCAQISR
jgi:hypothetical protein